MTWYEVVGWFASVCFFGRFLIQWLASERARRSVTPASFWWISLFGSLAQVVYLDAIGEPVLLLGASINGCLATRNLWLAHHAQAARRIGTLPATAVGLLASGVLVVSGLHEPRESWTHAPAWLVVSVLGQGLWSARFVVQWWYAERRHTPGFPTAFWWISLVGNLLLLAYAAHLGNPILIAQYVPSPFVQARNLILDARHRRGNARSTAIDPEGSQPEPQLDAGSSASARGTEP
jgi:lipid-A-disaccharide synthase-like uncharacterized protein